MKIERDMHGWHCAQQAQHVGIVETSINDSDRYSDGWCDGVMPKIGCDG